MNLSIRLGSIRPTTPSVSMVPGSVRGRDIFRKIENTKFNGPHENISGTG